MGSQDRKVVCKQVKRIEELNSLILCGTYYQETYTKKSFNFSWKPQAQEVFEGSSRVYLILAVVCKNKKNNQGVIHAYNLYCENLFN